MLYYTKTELKERGWTDKTIKELLPEPQVGRNPMYPSKEVYKFPVDVVLVAEETEAFKTLLAKREKRQEAAYKAVQTRYERNERFLQRKLDELQIEELTEEELLVYTIANKADYFSQKLDYLEDYEDDYEWTKIYSLNSKCEFFLNNETEKTAVELFGKPTINRWEVNFIRHNLTNYDYLINGLSGVPHKDWLIKKLKVAIFDKISKAYPYLAEESERQKHSYLQSNYFE